MASISKTMDSTESGANRRPLLQFLGEVSILIRSFAATLLGVAYRKMATEVGVSSDLRKGYDETAPMLDPVLANRAKGRWDPKEARWM